MAGRRGEGREWCGRSGQQSRTGGELCNKINILSEKKDFLIFINFKLLSQT
jgi:hypothetical protein